METFKELKDAIKANKKLVWNDPDPMFDTVPETHLIDEVFKLDDIEAYLNDMDDDEVEDLRGWPILIHYGGGSEAEVELSEIEFAEERKHFIIGEGLACAQEVICENIYEEEGPSKVFDYAEKVNMPYSYCKPCDNFTPTIVSRETDTCALCGSGKEIKEKYTH